MRKLASIQSILDICPIDGADRIEIATIKGWQCVVGKDEFHVGDQIVFLEIDSVTPQIETFKLLKDSNYRVKTRRFRKQISQGLCLPLSILSERETNDGTKFSGLYADGQDVTDILNITKYEPYIPANLAGIVKGNFPEFLHKTDEERINNAPNILNRHKNKEFYMSEKLDGSSMTVYYNNGVFGVCSRNLDLTETEDNTFWKTARKLRIDQSLRGCGNYAIQGELIGNGIQDNKYNLPGVEFRAFNVYDIDAHRYLDLEDFKRFIAACRLQTIPLLGTITLSHTVEQLLELVKGPSVLNRHTPREGIVFRPLIEEYDNDLHGRLSFKGINKEFLLKYNE